MIALNVCWWLYLHCLQGSWNASETDAANSCCGGKTTETTLETGCCGGNSIAMGAESTDGCRGDSFMNSGSNAQCTCLGTNCGSCTSKQRPVVVETKRVVRIIIIVVRLTDVVAMEEFVTTVHNATVDANERHAEPIRKIDSI